MSMGTLMVLADILFDSRLDSCIPQAAGNQGPGSIAFALQTMLKGLGLEREFAVLMS